MMICKDLLTVREFSTTETVKVPSGAASVADRNSSSSPAVGFVSKEAVTPVGRSDTLNPTGPSVCRQERSATSTGLPPLGKTPVSPCPVIEAAQIGPPQPQTPTGKTNATLTACSIEPSTAKIVTFPVAGTAPGNIEKAMLTVPSLDSESGAKVALTPGGRLATPMETFPNGSPTNLTDTATLVSAPAINATAPGAESEKSGTLSLAKAPGAMS